MYKTLVDIYVDKIHYYWNTFTGLEFYKCDFNIKTIKAPVAGFKFADL